MKFQGKLEISQSWFDLDLDWIEIDFSTREPDLYKKLFQSHDDTQDNNTLKKLDIEDFYKRKQMNEEMEAEIIKTDSRPENLAVSENASVDEAVPIDIRKEQKTKAYK